MDTLAPIPASPHELLTGTAIKERITDREVTEKVDETATKKTESEGLALEVVEEPKVIPSTTSSTTLADLASVERLFIVRRLRVRGVIFLRGKRNRFYVRTPEKDLLYTVEEENSWWVGYFCYGLRPFQLCVKNSEGDEVIRIYRPYAFTMRLLPCQLQRMSVHSPPGTRIGTIQQDWSAVRPIYKVQNANGDILFWIRGPMVTVSCFNDVKFQIMRPDGTPVGATCKRWEGIIHALFYAPVTDRCGVAFDVDLAPEEKALLLASTLLLNYMYYDI